MNYFSRLLFGLVLTLSVLCPALPALAWDSGSRSDPADTSQAPWRGQDYSEDQQRRLQQQPEEQRADFQRYQSDERRREEQQNWERREQRRQDIQGNPYQQQHNFGVWPPR